MSKLPAKYNTEAGRKAQSNILLERINLLTKLQYVSNRDDGICRRKQDTFDKWVYYTHRDKNQKQLIKWYNRKVDVGQIPYVIQRVNFNVGLDGFPSTKHPHRDCNWIFSDTVIEPRWT